MEIGLKKNEALEAASRKGLGLQTDKSKRNAAPKPPFAHFANLLPELRGGPGEGTWLGLGVTRTACEGGTRAGHPQGLPGV